MDTLSRVAIRKRKTLNTSLFMILAFTILIVFPSMIIQGKMPNMEKKEYKLTLESVTPIDDNFIKLNFIQENGDRISYNIHQIYETKIALNRNYDITYVKRSLSPLRPDNEIRSIVRSNSLED